MYAEMMCGSCDATFSIDAEDEDPTWLLIMRFANAHAACGYMTASTESDDSPARKVIMPRLTGEAEEA